MPHKIYIDTNVYLTFYHFSKDDLEELKKLVLLVENGDLELYLPEQTKIEFYRNREVKIADALSKMRDQKLSNNFPQISKAYDEYDLMRKALREYDKNKQIILEKLSKDAADGSLKADEIISKIFDKAVLIETTGELLQKAKIRFDLGNPPGKNKSYGDALNWESLLEKIPLGEDLYFITEDSDYFSQLDRNRFNPFLSNEWRDHKGSNIIHFKEISAFFKDKFPTITLSSELEKDITIKKLASAGSFASAKIRLGVLSKFSEFTEQQLNDIVEASVSNNQIYWISDDWGVKDVLEKIIQGNENKIEQGNLDEYIRLFRTPDPSSDDLL